MRKRAHDARSTQQQSYGDKSKPKPNPAFLQCTGHVTLTQHYLWSTQLSIQYRLDFQEHHKTMTKCW